MKKQLNYITQSNFNLSTILYYSCNSITYIFIMILYFFHVSMGILGSLCCITNWPKFCILKQKYFIGSCFCGRAQLGIHVPPRQWSTCIWWPTSSMVSPLTHLGALALPLSVFHLTF